MNTILQEVMKEICEVAKIQEIIHTTNLEAIQDLLLKETKEEVCFSLFKAPLTLNSIVDRLADILVGFRALTDASFTLHVKGIFKIPVQLKAGEFQLAWANEAPFPVIRLVYYPIYFEDLKGEVTCIFACLNTALRRGLAQECTMPLGSDWIISHGSILEKETFTECQYCAFKKA